MKKIFILILILLLIPESLGITSINIAEGNGTVNLTHYLRNDGDVATGNYNFTDNLYTSVNSKLGFYNTNFSGTGIDVSGNPYISLKSDSLARVLVDGTIPLIALGSKSNDPNNKIMDWNIQSNNFYEQSVYDNGAARTNWRIVDMDDGTQTFNTDGYSSILKLNNATGNVESTGFFKGDGLIGSTGTIDFNYVYPNYYSFYLNQTQSFASVIALDNWQGERLMETQGGRGRWTFRNYAGGGASPGFHFFDYGEGGDIFSVEGNQSGLVFNIDGSGEVEIGNVTGSKYINNNERIYQAIGNTAVVTWESSNGLLGLEGQVAIIYNPATSSSSVSWLSDHNNNSFFGNPSFSYLYKDGLFRLGKFTTDGSPIIFDVELNTTHPDNIYSKWGESDDLIIGHDSADSIINSSSDLLIQASNMTIISDGGLTVKYSNGSHAPVYASDFVTFTEVETSKDALEYFKTGDQLLNNDGSVNHKAYDDCYYSEYVKDYSRPVYNYWNETVCREYQMPPVCNVTIIKGKNKCQMEEVCHKELREVEEMSALLNKLVKVNRNFEICEDKQVCRLQPDKEETICNEPEIKEFCITETKYNISYPYTILTEGTRRGCTMAKSDQALALLGKNIDLYDNLTDFETGIVVEELFTNTPKDKLSNEEKKAERESIKDYIKNNDARDNYGKLKKEIIPMIAEVPSYVQEQLDYNVSYNALGLIDDTYLQVIELELELDNLKVCITTAKNFEDMQRCITIE